jgi:hypothetical protein
MINDSAESILTAEQFEEIVTDITKGWTSESRRKGWTQM